MWPNNALFSARLSAWLTFSCVPFLFLSCSFPFSFPFMSLFFPFSFPFLFPLPFPSLSFLSFHFLSRLLFSILPFPVPSLAFPFFFSFLSLSFSVSLSFPFPFPICFLFFLSLFPFCFLSQGSGFRALDKCLVYNRNAATGACSQEESFYRSRERRTFIKNYCCRLGVII